MKYLILIHSIVMFCLFSIKISYAQIDISISKGESSSCVCDYVAGSYVKINELMFQPEYNNGSLFGSVGGGAEWIELFNQDTCNSSDISCFFIGSNTNEIDNFDISGGFVIPPGSVIPPGGFAVIRGINANPVPSSILASNGGRTIEIVINDPGSVCIGTGSRFWLPDAGGWLALYNDAGIPIDAVSWIDTFNCYTYGAPCVPPVTYCQLPSALAPYNAIQPSIKSYVCDYGIIGLSINRYPDGAAWVLNSFSTPTYGTSNNGATGPDNHLCDGTISVSVTGGTLPYTFKWNDPLESEVETLTGLCAGQYCVTVTDATGLQLDTCIDVNYRIANVSITTSNDSICRGDSLQIAVTGVDIYLWNTGETDSIIYKSPQATINYSVTGTTTDGCMDTDSIQINVFPNPLIIMQTTDEVCNRHNGVASSIVSGGISPYTYLWSSSPSDESLLSGLSAGSYNLVVTDLRGCTDAAQFQINNISGPMASFVPTDYDVLLGNPISFINTSAGSIVSNVWAFGDDSVSFETNPSHVYEVLGEYMVWLTVIDDSGCADTVCCQVFIRDPYTFYVPNAFSPNSDNNNDFFMPFATGISIDDFEMRIFNRWGNELFCSHDVNKPWNGYINGTVAPQDVYIYRIYFRDRDHNNLHEIIGHVTLLY